MHFRKVLFVLAAAFAAGLSTGVCAQTAWLGSEPGAVAGSVSTLTAATSPMRRTDLARASAASCAANACHGGPRSGVDNAWASRGSEYPLWLTRDPHALAWKSLCSPMSTNILTKLGIVVRGKVVDQAGFDNCLACHNTTQTRLAETPSDFHAEGVGCNACHGPSEKWGQLHYRQDLQQAAAPAIGLIASQDLLTRARMCASCHVGDADRDMNHDLIAAGHPPLHYEFTTYYQRLPKHWRDANAGEPNFEAKLWLAGQIASLDANLTLLEARASNQLPISRWPEFAAHDCAACHQQLRMVVASPTVPREGNSQASPFSGSESNLSEQSPSKLDEAAPTRAGVPVSRWHTHGFTALLGKTLDGSQLESTSTAKDLEDSLRQLAHVMEYQPIPERRQTLQAIRLVHLHLDRWVDDNGSKLLTEFSADLLARCVASSQPAVGWEEHCQLYLVLVASRDAWLGKPPGNQLLDTAVQLRLGLLHTPGLASFSLLDHPETQVPTTANDLRSQLRSLAP